MGQIATVVHALGVFALVPAYVMLLVLGAELLAGRGPGESGPGLGIVALAVVDVAILYGVALTSRLRRGALYTLLATVFYGTKILGTGPDLAWLPLALVLPALVLTLMGRRPVPAEAWKAPPRAPGERALEVLLLGAVLYPVLSLLAAHGTALIGALRGHPLILQVEMLRGLLMVGLALPILRTTRGPWWVGGWLLTGVFALLPNDAHWLPRSLVERDAHLVATVVTGGLFAWATAWLVQRPSGPALLAPPGVRSA